LVVFGEIPMSVKRLVVSLDLGAVNVSQFCREHGLGRTQFYEIRRRYEDEGVSGLQPRSRAPRTVANKTPLDVEDQIVRLRKELDDAGLDAGAETIQWHLINTGSEHVPSVSTVWRILTHRGLIEPDPSKAPTKQWKRFVAERANELFQIDGTDYTLVNNTVVKVINVIDDGSRYCPASSAHSSESFDAAWATICAAFVDNGKPARLLSDNSKAFRKLETPLAILGIATTHSRVHHPQTCGKVERFHQTQAKWLAAQHQAHTIAELQQQLEQFRIVYNHQRPHRGIGRRTPATQWQAMAKTGPATEPLNTDTPTRVHHSTTADNGAVSVAGYAISIGAKHRGKPVTTIITGLKADLFIEGTHIRALTIDPAQRVQPLHPRQGRPRKTQP